MTEDEAKTKWCPPSWGSNLPSRCVGASCMAWRERAAPGSTDTVSIIRMIREYHEEHRVDLLTAKKAVEASLADAPGDGYCGVAGGIA